MSVKMSNESQKVFVKPVRSTNIAICKYSSDRNMAMTDEHKQRCRGVYSPHFLGSMIWAPVG